MIELLCSSKQPYPKRIMQSFVNINFTHERQKLLKLSKLFFIIKMFKY